MPERANEEDLELLGELGVETKSANRPERSSREQRIIAGFEEIERFVDEHGRLPRHGENRYIFERLYAVRLDRIRDSAECREVLEGLDSKGLLNRTSDGDSGELREDAIEYRTTAGSEAENNDEELLAALEAEPPSGELDIADLKHVRSRTEIRAAEEVAQRNPCADFNVFRPLFEIVRNELESGERRTLKFKDNAEVNKGDLFVLDGQKALVAEMGEPFVSDYGRLDRRLRVIYDNGTESDLLLRSLQRALNKDKSSRRISRQEFGPLFSGQEEETDQPAGCIYVLRSLSNHPFIVEHRDVIHKIGVTGGDVKRRIVNARKEPAYLMAEVEVVATFKLANINRQRLESLLHKFFAEARLDMELKDRFGFAVEPREWFLVPLPIIQAAIEKLMGGSISDFRYDTESAGIVPRR